ncbi:UL16-binding protein 6-like [Molossus molossus]|uniref:UL16-binding protein 6-like n=1 Tax=Molossus molossus TaxID=27622 RepID=UPI0017477A1A|nr:UL16-binding protein 6-like [Molossus molossus]
MAHSDLKDVPPPSADEVLFTDGSSYVQEAIRHHSTDGITEDWCHIEGSLGLRDSYGGMGTTREKDSGLGHCPGRSARAAVSYAGQLPSQLVMVRTSGSRFSLILLVLALLPDCPRAADCPLLRGGAISLGYKFTITPSGQPWCEIQGQANGNTFFSFTCGSKQVKLINIQETKRNDTEAWNQQRDTLKYVMEELKKKLLEVRAEKSAISNSLFLQGNIKCEESSEDRMAYSDFGLNKYTSVRLNSDTRSWIVLKDEGRMLKEILASDRAMTDLLVKTSAGDCRMWLKQVLCHQDGVLSTKGNSAQRMKSWSLELASTLFVSVRCAWFEKVIHA